MHLHLPNTSLLAQLRKRRYFRQLIRWLRLALILHVAVFSNALLAYHNVSICNDGDATVQFATLDENGFPDTGSAILSGWTRLEPGDCSRTLTVGLRIYYGFVQEQSDGNLTNPIFRPDNLESIDDTLNYMCVVPEKNFEVTGVPRNIRDSYGTSSCPEGYSAIRKSFVAYYSIGLGQDLITTVYVTPTRLSGGEATASEPLADSVVDQSVTIPSDRRFRMIVTEDYEAWTGLTVYDVPDGVVPNLDIDSKQLKGVKAKIDGTPKPRGVIWMIEFGQMNVAVMDSFSGKRSFSNDQINKLDALYATSPLTRMWFCSYAGYPGEMYWHSNTPLPPEPLLQQLTHLDIGIASECPARPKGW